MAVPRSLPSSWARRRLPSTRRRDTYWRAATLSDTTTIPTRVSTASYWKRRTAKKAIIRAPRALVARSRDRSWATRSLIPTRELMSPAKRWLKNSVGRRSTCQRKREELAHGQAGLEAQQVTLLEPGESAQQQGGEAHGEEERRQPVVAALQQHAVQEDLGEDGHDQARDGQCQARQQHEGEAGPGARETALQGREEPGRLAPPLEAGPGLEGQHHAGEGLIQLLLGDHPRACAGIVEVDLPLAEPLQHHEVVEVPVQDGGHPLAAQGLGLAA